MSWLNISDLNCMCVFEKYLQEVCQGCKAVDIFFIVVDVNVYAEMLYTRQMIVSQWIPVLF